MLQAKILDKGSIILEEINVPEPKKNKVLLKINYAGICGTDALMMKDSSLFSYPVVMGHEIAGTVASEGKKFKKGTRATIIPYFFCGKCKFCAENLHNLCESREAEFIGASPVNGGFAEYITVDENNIFALPDSITDETAALIEPVSVVYHGVNLSNPSKIKKAMIIGVGTIGLIAVRILKNKYNINDITAIDLSDKKLKMAQRSGANTIINLKDKNWQTVDELVKDPQGSYDVVFDYVSSSQSIEIALANLRRNGRMIAAGVPHADIAIGREQYFSIILKELIINASFCYVRQDYIDVIDMLANKIINIEDMVSSKYRLKDILNAFSDLEKNPDWYKVLIKP
jgi:L-iditol 2-dehydrogenase